VRRSPKQTASSLGRVLCLLGFRRARDPKEPIAPCGFDPRPPPLRMARCQTS
jgi:hypothetical protein